MPALDLIVIDGCQLTILDVVHVARDRQGFEIAKDAWEKIERGRDCVETSLAAGSQAYGVTTGVGSQKEAPVASSESAAFNRQLLIAHATTSTSLELTPTVVRAALLVQLNGFVSGRSGVSPGLVRALYDRFTRETFPRANAGVSVGASDLVPLAQMALSLIGATNPLGEPSTPSQTHELAPKEALSLINSNAVSLGHGALTLLQARKMLRGFDLAAALSLEGFRGNAQILHPAILAAHPQQGQITATRHVNRLLSGSRLLELGQARNLQDPLSFRCMPQVHGAVYSALEWVWNNLEIELNTVQDNPCVDLESAKLVSNGNMDGTLLTLGFDNLRSALVAAVDTSAQRLHKLHWPEFSGLPSGLNKESSALGGVQFLNLSHIAEAYAAAARRRANPSLLNYQGQLADGVEDYATLLPLAITDTEHLIESAWVVQALEIIIACWAIRRRNVPVADLGEGVRAVYDRVERLLPIGTEGTAVFDVRPIVELVTNETLVDLIDAQAPPIRPFEASGA